MVDGDFSGVSCFFWGEDPQQMMGPGTANIGTSMPSECPSNTKNHQKPKTSPGFLHLHQLQSQAPACYDQASAHQLPAGQLWGWFPTIPTIPMTSRWDRQKTSSKHHPDTERQMNFQEAVIFFHRGYDGMTISLNYPIFRRKIIGIDWWGASMVHPHLEKSNGQTMSNHRCFSVHLLRLGRCMTCSCARRRCSPRDRWRSDLLRGSSRKIRSSSGLMCEHIKYHDTIYIYIYILYIYNII